MEQPTHVLVIVEKNDTTPNAPVSLQHFSQKLNTLVSIAPETKTLSERSWLFALQSDMHSFAHVVATAHAYGLTCRTLFLHNPQWLES